MNALLTEPLKLARSAVDATAKLSGAALASMTDLLVARILEAGVVERVVVEVLTRPETEALIARTLERPELERLVVVAIDSPGTDRIVRRVLESPGTDRAVTTVLASVEMQRIVEHIANSPEVQSAIQQQSLGLANSVAGEVRAKSVSADDGIERLVRRVLRRPARSALELTDSTEE